MLGIGPICTSGAAFLAFTCGAFAADATLIDAAKNFVDRYGPEQLLEFGLQVYALLH